MRGLLADVNVQGHLGYVRRRLETAGLWPVFAELQLDLTTFGRVGLPENGDDRQVWTFCQEQGWVLLTENRNDDGNDSLQATIADSWRMGCLPVLTLADKTKFERSRDYAQRVVNGIAEVLFGIATEGRYCDQPRIYLPL
jgi:hypothetical protein